MKTVALVVILAFALWIAAAGVAALAKPTKARNWIGRFASSYRVNIAEQVWRGMAGAALVARAPVSLTPGVFAFAGWILIASAAVLIVIPLRWHAGYAQWWSRNLPLPIVRLAGVASLIFAVWLTRSAWG